MNNTDLQVRFSKETKQQVLQTGKQMNLYYTDEYVRWLEDIVLKQANGAETEQDKCHIQRVNYLLPDNKCNYTGNFCKGDSYNKQSPICQKCEGNCS